jgi:CheY-like chemotaxis protein
MAHPDTILIVDDHADLREGMQHMLETEGYGVQTAANGREALALLFRGLRPCVIVMDLAMPVMNGFEFRQEQLKHSDIADIPFIAYSAVVDVQQHAQHLRAAAYLEKPIEFQHVLSIIRQHCEH